MRNYHTYDEFCDHNPAEPDLHDTPCPECGVQDALVADMAVYEYNEYEWRAHCLECGHQVDDSVGHGYLPGLHRVK